MASLVFYDKSCEMGNADKANQKYDSTRFHLIGSGLLFPACAALRLPVQGTQTGRGRQAEK